MPGRPELELDPLVPCLSHALDLFQEKLSDAKAVSVAATRTARGFKVTVLGTGMGRINPMVEAWYSSEGEVQSSTWSPREG